MTDSKKANTLLSALTYDDVRAVSPALEHYTKGALLDGLWKRPELSSRDRSIVTVAALVARIQTIEMPFHFALALDNGVTPCELSEIITHLAFYSGWANAMSPIAVAKDIFHQHGIGIDQLSACERKAAPFERRRLKPTSRPGEQQLRAGLARTRAKQYRPALPRVVAPPRTGTPRPQPRDGECADRFGAGCTNHLPSESRDGQRADSAPGF